MRVQSHPKLTKPSVGEATCPHSPAARVGKSCWGGTGAEDSSPGRGLAPLSPWLLTAPGRTSKGIVFHNNDFSPRPPSGELAGSICSFLRFQSLEKCWNVLGDRCVVPRMNEGVKERAQGEADIRDVERLSDPAHSTFVTDPGPSDPQPEDRSSGSSVTISGAWRRLWSTPLLTNG